MRRLFGRLLIALAVAAILLPGCNRSDQPGTPGPQTPTTPTTPTSPANPDPPTQPPGPQACAFTLTAEPDDFGPEGGNALLRIATGAACGWTVKTDVAWLAVEGSASGTGPAALKVLAQPNATAERRQATVAVNDTRVTMSQDGQQACDYKVEPVAIVIPRKRWTGDVSISTAPGCRWTATSAVPWLRLGAGDGSGPARLAYEADFNPQTEYAAQRQGVIEIRWTTPTAGQNVRVNQWGDCRTAASPAPAPLGLPPGATYSGSLRDGGTVTLGPAGGRVHFFVLTDPFMGCAWSAESDDTWITWNSPRLHQVNQGDGDLVFTVPAKSWSETRRATVRLDRWTLTIVQ
jgi:hypothetical protein